MTHPRKGRSVVGTEVEYPAANRGRKVAGGPEDEPKTNDKGNELQDVDVDAFIGGVGVAARRIK
jgi:hypothetical protein